MNCFFVLIKEQQNLLLKRGAFEPLKPLCLRLCKENINFFRIIAILSLVIRFDYCST